MVQGLGEKQVPIGAHPLKTFPFPVHQDDIAGHQYARTELPVMNLPLVHDGHRCHQVVVSEVDLLQCLSHKAGMGRDDGFHDA